MKQINLKLNPETDQDLLHFLSDKPMTYAIKKALRAYIANNPHEVPPAVDPPAEVPAAKPVKPVVKETPKPKKAAAADDDVFGAFGPKK